MDLIILNHRLATRLPDDMELFVHKANLVLSRVHADRQGKREFQIPSGDYRCAAGSVSYIAAFRFEWPQIDCHLGGRTRTREMPLAAPEQPYGNSENYNNACRDSRHAATLTNCAQAV